MRTKLQPTYAVTPAPPENELERYVYDALIEARDSNKAVSRKALIAQLTTEKKVAPKEAFAVVEAYCDSHAPSTPEYLGNEFELPYLKVVASLLVITGLVTTYIGLKSFGTLAGGIEVTVGLLAIVAAFRAWTMSVLRETRKK